MAKMQTNPFMSTISAVEILVAMWYDLFDKLEFDEECDCMLNKKNIIFHLLSLCGLCIGFVLCRYVFFDIHGMKEWPVDLFVVGIVFMVISFFLKCKIAPICTSVAYLIGFVAGTIFQTNGVDVGGGTTNNLWIIWTIVFVCITLTGIICEKFIGSVKKKSS